MAEKSDEIPFFSLKKYYMDMITEGGQYFIGYSARLKFGALRLSYCATITDPSLTGIQSGPILYSSEDPVIDKSTLSWQSKRLGFEGLWRKCADAIDDTLLEAREGKVNWQCLQPLSQVELKTQSGKIYAGLGYAELLNMTIKPWGLGLKALYWGRFVSATHSVVWIEWQGTHPLTLLILNGKNMRGAVISDTNIICDEFNISLERQTTIRRGSLGNTVFSKVPSILKRAPVEFLNVKEEKFLSSGLYKTTDGDQCEGWVIHEKIIWP